MNRQSVNRQTVRLTLEQLETREVPAVLVDLSDDRSVVELDNRAAALVGTSNYTIANGPVSTDTRFLDALKANGNNFTRVWTQFHFADGASPFERTRVNGRLKYDLTKIDSAYLDKLLAFVRKANDRNIVVQVCLFDPIQIEDPKEYPNRWKFSPYNPSNSETAFLTNDNNRFRQFLDSTGNVWQKVRSNLIDKVVSHLKNETNVIYEVMNEPTISQGIKSLPGAIVAFHSAAITRINSNLVGGTGSKLVSVNTQISGRLFDWAKGVVGVGGRAAGDPRVDIVSYHIDTVDQASEMRSYPRPTIISTDGPLAVTLKDLDTVVSLALGGKVRYGSRHVELLDNGILGTSRGSFTETNYKIDTRLIARSSAIAEFGKAYVRPAGGTPAPSKFVLVRGLSSSETDRMNAWSFYPEWYLKTNPDVARLQGNDPGLAFRHWQRQGLAQGLAPNPFFKPRIYLARNPDLQAEFGRTGYVLAATHWLASGIYEGRVGA